MAISHGDLDGDTVLGVSLRLDNRKNLEKLMTQSTNKYTYTVKWSEEDEAYVAICLEFPSLSWVAPSIVSAFSGILDAVRRAVKDLEENGEFIPQPQFMKIRQIQEVAQGFRDFETGKYVTWDELNQILSGERSQADVMTDILDGKNEFGVPITTHGIPA